MPVPPCLSRRQFLATSAALATAALGRAADAAPAEPIIDIHQHTDYGGTRDAEWRIVAPGRGHAALVAHQRAMGVTKTILQPSGHPVLRASTHFGRGNGLESTCTPNEVCYALAQEHPGEFYFAANEVSDLDTAPREIEKYLKLGAVMIGEQKFGVECDSPAMQRIYELATEYAVPVLMHWQFKSYNYGFERFHRMLEKYPQTNFIGHAPTWWAHIDLNYEDDEKNLYPRGKVTPGGLTERYLRDYPNIYGDLAAASGRNAFARNEAGRAFIERFQDKLLFGSDCTDSVGHGGRCTGAMQIAQVRALAPSKAVERKLLYENARKLVRF